MAKVYFETPDAETVDTITNFRKVLTPPFTLFKAVSVAADDDGGFWCRATEEYAEKGDCGTDCPYYAPKNGKSGICRHKGRVLVPGEPVEFKQ